MNPESVAPTWHTSGFDLLHREALRIRVRDDHDPFVTNSPILIHYSRLPSAETGQTRNVMYRGDGGPDDLLPP